MLLAELIILFTFSYQRWEKTSFLSISSVYMSRDFIMWRILKYSQVSYWMHFKFRTSIYAQIKGRWSDEIWLRKQYHFITYNSIMWNVRNVYSMHNKTHMGFIFFFLNYEVNIVFSLIAPPSTSALLHIHVETHTGIWRLFAWNIKICLLM